MRRLFPVFVWDNPTSAARAQQLADWPHTASRGRVTYRVVDTQTSDTLPRKADGFVYDEASFCRAHDGNVGACNAEAGCAYYVCSSTCWPKGTPDGVACP